MTLAGDASSRAAAGPWGPLGAAATVSLALHSALLVGLQPEFAQSVFRSHGAPLIVRLSEIAAAPEAAPMPVAVRERMTRAAPPAAGEAAQGIRERAPAAPGVEVSLPGAPVLPYYYRASELDRGPAPLAEISPQYPAGVPPQAGKVRLRVLLDERGVPQEVAVVHAQPERVFDASAVGAFSSARYSPGILNGVPVKSQLLLEVDYAAPDGREPRFAGNRSSY